MDSLTDSPTATVVTVLAETFPITLATLAYYVATSDHGAPWFVTRTDGRTGRMGDETMAMLASGECETVFVIAD